MFIDEDLYNETNSKIDSLKKEISSIFGKDENTNSKAKGDVVNSVLGSENPLESSKMGGLESMIGGEGTGDVLSSLIGTKTGDPSSVVDFGMDIFNTSQTTNQSDFENIVNPIKLTQKGAQAGMAVGGPWGAAIGGAVGLTYGVVDSISDMNRKSRLERQSNKERFDFLTNKAKVDQDLKDGKLVLENRMNLIKKQLNYLK